MSDPAPRAQAPTVDVVSQKRKAGPGAISATGAESESCNKRQHTMGAQIARHWVNVARFTADAEPDSAASNIRNNLGHIAEGGEGAQAVSVNAKHWHQVGRFASMFDEAEAAGATLSADEERRLSGCSSCSTSSAMSDLSSVGGDVEQGDSKHGQKQADGSTSWV